MKLQKENRWFHWLRSVARTVLLAFGAIGVTLMLFLVLPLMQTINKPPTGDLALQAVDTAQLDAPEPPPEPEQEKEPEQPEEQPPELSPESAPLDLSQLELALNPGFGEGGMAGDFAVDLKTVTTKASNMDALFSLSDLDQKPRAVYQPSPKISKEMRRHTPGTVTIIFVVDKQGRVENATVQKSTDSIFDRAALSAIQRWKFEPGKRNGEAVRFRMRVPITFPEG